MQVREPKGATRNYKILFLKIDLAESKQENKCYDQRRDTGALARLKTQRDGPSESAWQQSGIFTSDCVARTKSGI